MCTPVVTSISLLKKVLVCNKYSGLGTGGRMDLDRVRVR